MSTSSASSLWAEGKRGGEFFTPRPVVRTMVEILEPYSGRVYDPCCGSGGMFVQSEKFIEDNNGDPREMRSTVRNPSKRPGGWQR